MHSSRSPSFAVLLAPPLNKISASTGAAAKSPARTNGRCADSRKTSPSSPRTGTSTPSILSQQPPFTRPENMIFSSFGKRIAHEPPAVKLPDTTVSALANLRMSEQGSLLISVLSRKLYGLSSIHSPTSHAHIECWRTALMTLSKRKLGRQGLEVSSIGLGCMGMSQSYGPADERESIATLHRAIELGCSFFDTAEGYGPFTNEELLGRAFKGRRSQVVIGTKFGLRFKDGKQVGTERA